MRSFSSCSSTSDDGIEFSGPSESSHVSKSKGGKSPDKKCSFVFYNSDDEDSEDTDDDSDDDDEDWDEVDGDATLIDVPDEFKVGFYGSIWW